MERLTSYDENMGLLVNEEERILSAKGFIDKDEMYKIMRHLAEKLKEYEDLEGKGKLLKLPCAVGDMVYAFYMAKVIELEVIKISWFTMDRGNVINVECLNTDWDCFRNFVFEEFGKAVFLTKEEADSALKELQKG